MTNFIEQATQALQLMLDGTKSFYATLYSIPIVDILRENVAVIGITLYMFSYIKAYLSRTELVSQEGSIMHRLAERMASIHSGYRPTIWCYGAALNTVVLAFIQKVIKHEYYREVLKTPDGGLVAIDWASYDHSEKKMILLVLPGLTGSSKANYVTHLVEKAGKYSLYIQ